MMISRSIHVAGATGAVGSKIVIVLMKAGHSVRTLSLDEPPKDVWPVGVDEHFGDVTDTIVVQHVIHGVEFVIHLAALLHIVKRVCCVEALKQRREFLINGNSKV